MILSIILWVLFGAVVGWIASLIMRTDQEQGAVANIIVGIVGAFLGGLIASLVGTPGVSGINFTNLVVAIIGSVVLLFFIRVVSGGRSHSIHN